MEKNHQDLIADIDEILQLPENTTITSRYKLAMEAAREKLNLNAKELVAMFPPAGRGRASRPGMILKLQTVKEALKQQQASTSAASASAPTSAASALATTSATSAVAALTLEDADEIAEPPQADSTYPLLLRVLLLRVASVNHRIHWVCVVVFVCVEGAHVLLYDSVARSNIDLQLGERVATLLPDDKLRDDHWKTVDE